MASTIFKVTAVAAIVGQVLSKSDFTGIANVSVEDLEKDFLEELANSTSASIATKSRILTLESTLRQTFTVVPKGGDGTMSQSVVRYVLHRFFVRKHGWFIRGLEPGSETIKAESNVRSNSQEWIPSYLLNFLEHTIAGRGVNLRELAVLAATMEDLVRREELGHLHKAYSTLWLDEEEPLSSEESFSVMETYMMIYLLGGNFTISSPSKAHRLLELFGKKVASWDKTVLWLQRIHQKYSSVAQTFDATSKMVAEVGERYGIFNDDECSRMKTELMKMESQKPGRVRLVDFYKRSLFGPWEFNEKMDYLKAAGLLDESDPKTPLVILPNYVASRPNCMLSSSFYAVCCRNQCEDLMDTLEREIGGPNARPSQISKIVSKLTTDTIQAPRPLPKSLMRRLQEVAERNHGQVPLHGRLFAQWMHHAFPRECPYPNEAGTAAPLTPDEWMQKTGQEDSKASKEEMMSMISNDNCRLVANGVDCGGMRVQQGTEKDDGDLPWDSKEELLVMHQEQPRHTSLRRGVALNPMRDLVILISFLSISWLASVVFFGKKSKICWTMLSWRSMSFSSAVAKAERCCV